MDEWMSFDLQIRYCQLLTPLHLVPANGAQPLASQGASPEPRDVQSSTPDKRALGESKRG